MERDVSRVVDGRLNTANNVLARILPHRIGFGLFGGVSALWPDGVRTPILDSAALQAAITVERLAGTTLDVLRFRSPRTRPR
jgi:hypothetical protein